MNSGINLENIVSIKKVGSSADTDTQDTEECAHTDTPSVAGETYYDILGVSPHTSTKDIAAVYQAVMMRCRMVGDMEKALRVEHAFQILSDPAGRRDYDVKQGFRRVGEPIFDGDRKAAYAALVYRKNHPPRRLDNKDIKAGKPMYYYCAECGAVADMLPEDFVGRPKKLCGDCCDMVDMGFL